MFSQACVTNMKCTNESHLVEGVSSLSQRWETGCRLTLNDTRQNVGGNWKQILCCGGMTLLLLCGVI